MGLFDIFRRRGDAVGGGTPGNRGTRPGEDLEPLVVDALVAPSVEAVPDPGGAGDPAGMGGADTTGAPPGPIDAEAIETGVVEALRGVYDPEIPVDIYELGLIYGVRVSPDAVVEVRMTLTAPNCPAAGMLPAAVEAAARRIPGVRDVRLDLTFDPPWNPDMMTDAAKLQLGLL